MDHASTRALSPVFAALLFMVCSSCSSAKPDPAASDGALDPIPDVTAPPLETSEPKAPTTATTTEPKGPAEREISGRECEALAQKYSELTKSDQMAALKPGLTEAQREQGRAAIDKAAATLSSRWRDSCLSTLVGKVASEEALRCSMSAKSVAAFDVCLNGPSTPPP